MTPDAQAASYVGGGSTELFREIGEQLVGWFKLYADLKPTDRVLDVGCGIGRVAIALTQYLTTGQYVGFDVVRHGIDWCHSRITPSYPGFRFFHADIYNQLYNPTGKIKPFDYAFPFAEQSFDFIFLTSVFTHMLPREVEHYLREIGRTLAPGGRCLFTAFIVSREGAEHLESGDSVRRFVSQPGGFWTDNPSNPEAAVAYPEAYLTEVVRNAEMSIRRIVPGGWWANTNAQDIVVIERR